MDNDYLWEDIMRGMKSTRWRLKSECCVKPPETDTERVERIKEEMRYGE